MLLLIEKYAGSLLAQAHIKEGKSLLHQAFELTDENQQSLILERWFYTLTHFPDRADQTRKEINELLTRGVRSIGWDFSSNINRAEKDGCEYVEDLQTLAESITTE